VVTAIARLGGWLSRFHHLNRTVVDFRLGLRLANANQRARQSGGDNNIFHFSILGAAGGHRSPLSPIWHFSGVGSGDCGPKTCPRGPIASEKARMTMDERPRLTASEIEAQLIAELQKLPSLRDTQSVRIRPYSGPKGWTWELDRIEPEVGPTQIKFVDLATVVGQLQQQYDLDLSPPPPA
jgi:hypothetical protein